MTDTQGCAFGQLLYGPIEDSLLVMKMTQVTWKEQDYGAVMVPRNIRDGGRICKGNTVVVLGFFRETERIGSIIYRKRLIIRN